MGLEEVHVAEHLVFTPESRRPVEHAIGQVGPVTGEIVLTRIEDVDHPGEVDHGREVAERTSICPSR